MMAMWWLFILLGLIVYYLERIHSVLYADRQDRRENDSLEERMAAARFMREAQDRANARALIGSTNALAEEQIKKR